MDTAQRLRWAVAHNKLNMVTLIIEKHPKLLRNIDPSNGWSNLHYATHNDCYEVVAYLIHLGHEKHEVSLTHARETALHLAAAGNHEKSLHFLAQHIQKSIDWVNSAHETALMVACREGHEPCVALLLDFGADIDKGDGKGTRPLHVACARGYVKVLRTLIDRDADVLTANQDGWTPMDFAMSTSVQGYLQSLIREHSRLRQGPSTPTEQKFTFEPMYQSFPMH